MGFLRKAFKKVKKGIKKVARGIKKVVKKISKSKILKTIALVGAALVTGGAAVGAFGGQFASSAVGRALIGAKNFITGLPVVGTVAKPFEFIGTALGTGAGKVTDFLGITNEASRLDLKLTPEMISGEVPIPQALKGVPIDPSTGLPIPDDVLVKDYGFTPQTTSTGFFGTTAGQFVRDVGMSYVESKLQPEPEYPGEFIGYGSAPSPILDPLQVSFAQPAVNLNDAYSNLQFGTGDVGYLASDLYRQETVGGMA